MEKTARRQQVIKWQLILGAVVCAFIVFCVLPGSIISASAETKTVQYVDMVWNEKTKQVDEITTITDENGESLPLTHECTVLTKEICKSTYGMKGGDTAEKAAWYVLDSDITHNKFRSIRVRGHVNLVLGNGHTLTATKKDAIHLYPDATLTIYREQQTYDENNNPKSEGKLVLDGQLGHAGIGVNEGSTLVIKGGNIKASGTISAGIGSDNGETAGTIEILGGTVDASGGDYGAGIGGKNGSIIINGGDVTARGENKSAGIGGGNEENAGAIKINGGKVNATGGFHAAGIGSGHCADGATIEINGGQITAEGGKYAAGIGSSVYIFGKQKAGSINITGGTITAKGNEYGAGIGSSTLYVNNVYSEKHEEFISITGGNINSINGSKHSGTNIPYPFSLHTITLAGVTEPVSVIDTNCDSYGINDVYTLHDIKKDANTGKETLGNGKLYFCMKSAEYLNLTEITVRDKEGHEQLYVRAGNSDTFKKPVNITGVFPKDAIYDGSFKSGYIGNLTNEQNYTEGYKLTYYILDEGEYKETTTQNSGAFRNGMPPVYAGDYKLRIELLSTLYYGYCDLDFKIEKATPTITTLPKLSGVYGTQVKDMEITEGVADVGGIEIEGLWEVIDFYASDIPDVGTTNSYKVMFTPEDDRNCNPAIVKVVPEVYEATDTIQVDSIVSETSSENKRQKLIYKIKDKISKFSEDEFKHKFLNSELISTENKKEIKNRLLDPETRKAIGDKILNFTFIVNSEIKEKFEVFLLYPEIQNKIIYKITSSEIIKNEKVKEKLLGFIEE